MASKCFNVPVSSNGTKSTYKAVGFTNADSLSPFVSVQMQIAGVTVIDIITPDNARSLAQALLDAAEFADPRQPHGRVIGSFTISGDGRNMKVTGGFDLEADGYIR